MKSKKKRNKSHFITLYKVEDVITYGLYDILDSEVGKAKIKEIRNPHPLPSDINIVSNIPREVFSDLVLEDSNNKKLWLLEHEIKDLVMRKIL